MKTTVICCIFNYPSHYREQIYRLMESELNCKFYFGDIEKGNIQSIDYKHFLKPIKDLKTCRFPAGFNWIKGSVPLIFKPYKKYILVGEPYCLSTWVCLLAAKMLGKKAYLWTHGWYGNENWTKAWIKKVFYNLSSGLFLYGDYAKNLMLKEGFRDENMHVVYNSLDYNMQSRVRSKLVQTDIYREHFGNDDPVLIFTGRLTKIKKLEQLIEAHKSLSAKNIPFNVVLLGDGSEKEYLTHQTERVGLDNRYWFYGSCYDESVIGELYYNATACISPGNIGLTGIHSLMYGCPVITHSNFSEQMPEFEAITPGETGAFFDYGNTDSLANTIENWLQNHFPKEDKLKDNCFRIIDEKFNPYYQIEVLKNGMCG